mgnify:FL=1
MNIEKDIIQPSEAEAVLSMQLRHGELLQESPVMEKIYTQALLDGHEEFVQNGYPIVLGSEYNGLRFLFIALRMSPELRHEKIKSQYYTVGRYIKDASLPNAELGITDDELEFVDAMFSEAEELVVSHAPHYSLESGILRDL